MQWLSQSLVNLPRTSSFPLQVSAVYFCTNQYFPYPASSGLAWSFEVSLRISSGDSLCHDLINGREMGVPFPNVVFKKKGTKVELHGEYPRDTISFQFSPAMEQYLNAWGLIPEETYWPIRIEEPLELLITEFRHLLKCYMLTGMIDRLDWTCLQMMRALLLQRGPATPIDDDPESRIRMAALYLQQHYNKNPDYDAVAAKFGFSHAVFYRTWKQVFAGTPKNYVLDYRLKTAALHLLLRNHLSIAEAARSVHFSSLTAFYRKFKELFNCSPDEFRHNRECWEKEFPDLDIQKPTR